MRGKSLYLDLDQEKAAAGPRADSSDAAPSSLGKIIRVAYHAAFDPACPVGSRANLERALTMQETLDLWHRCVESRDVGLLDDILAEDCIFLSPVVHTPQCGGEITRLYLTGAMQVLGGDHFRYIKEVANDQYAVLEFCTEVDDILVNGVDIMTFNEAGKVSEFKVMLRPLKAVNIVHAKMKSMLEQLSA